MTEARRVSAGSVAVTLAVIAAAAILTVARPTALAQAPPRPESSGAPALLVLLVVDQFRADYVDLFGHQWTAGLRELFTRGAVLTNAVVPYGLSRTCTGHASIGTGTLPSTHGLVDNEWFDRPSGRFVACTDDPSVEPVALGPGRVAERHSARMLRAPTLADELRRQAKQPPRVVAMGLKARSAISLVGHGGPRTIAVWEEDSGTWATSTAYATTTPLEVAAYVKAYPTAADRGHVWERRLPVEAYLYQDRTPSEPGGGAFPHVLAPSFGASFTPIWDASPLSDAYLGRLASTLIEHLPLGRSSSTDMLAVSFAALDYVGHAFGPRSHEVQDILARLDLVVGTLIDTLDREIGRDRYVLALSSDHGVAPLPDATSGRIGPSDIGRAIEFALGGVFGRRSFVHAIAGSSVYLQSGVLDRIRITPAAALSVERALSSVPGIARVFWADQLAASTPTTDALLTAMRRSYVADRSGDIMVVPERNWVQSAAGTNHGTPYDYDTRVPLVFLGSRVVPGRYAAASSVLDIAPTLASLSGVNLPRAEGRVLREILATPER